MANPKPTPTTKESEVKYAIWDKRVRDTALFILGLAGVINELFIKAEPQPYALIFLGSLLGLPFVLHADEKRRQSKEENDGSE